MIRTQKRTGVQTSTKTRTSGMKVGIEAAVPVTITLDGQSVLIAKKVEKGKSRRSSLVLSGFSSPLLDRE